MSAFRESVQKLLESGLRCPKCGATNRPRATYVTHEANDRASCMVCAYTAAVTAFEPRRDDV